MGNKRSSRDYDSQEVDNLEHDPSLHLKKVMPYGWDGSNAVALKVNSSGELTAEKPLKVDDYTTADVMYFGYAPIGTTSTSAAVWKIKKMDFTTGIVTTYADGDLNYDNIWDNRASLTYS